MTENEVLGFNPQDLFNNQSNDGAAQSPANSLIYKTQPSKSVSEDGHYRAKIKIIYNYYPKKAMLVIKQQKSLEKQWMKCYLKNGQKQWHKLLIIM